MSWQVADHIKAGTAEQFMAIGSSAFNDFYEREWITGNRFAIACA
jgi:hypothetical protein